MDLFDLMKQIFDRNSKWDSIKTYDKSKNFFMVNRFMSINFPMQANLFNNRHINSSSAVDSWKDVLNRLFTKPPSWMYTKTKKKDQHGSKKHPDKATVQEWMKLNKLSKKDFDSMLEIMEDEVIKEILNFEKILKEKNNAK
jgi:hypothetical protein